MSAQPDESMNIRVQRLEETVTFSDQTSDALGEEIRTIARSVEFLVRRLDALEARLTQIADRDQDPGLEAPPHSAGPDISRDPI